MRKTLWLRIMAVLLALASSTAYAATHAYSALVVFGDSYCDVGNLFLATGGFEPTAPYYDGRFSNGPLWVDHVAGFLGVPIQPSILGGTDYAFAGAWATEPQIIPGGTIPSVPEQVALYLANNKGKADPNALYVLEGGGNDILDATATDPDKLGFDIAKALAYSELLLRQAGARHFVIPNLFNVGLLPAAAGRVSFAAKASDAANVSLDILLAIEDHLEGVHILRMNVFGLFNAIQTDPFHFGFTNVTTPCLTTAVCADPDHTLFWDTHHPTEFGHAFFAVTLENALSQRTD